MSCASARSSGQRALRGGKVRSPRNSRRAEFGDEPSEKRFRCRFSRRRAHEVAFGDFDEDPGEPCKPPETAGCLIRRPVGLSRTRQVIQHDAQLGKPQEHVLQLRNAFCSHLQTDRKPALLGLAPCGKRTRIVQPAGLTRHGAPGCEEPQTRQPSVHPTRHRLARIGRENVAREDTGEPVRIGPDRVRHVRVVVSVAR